MHIYEYGGEILIVDCGIGFPDQDMPGVDVLIPDVSYLLNKKDKIKGLLVTHGHEDHFGAIPYVLPKLGKIPIYATPLVRGFIEAGIKDRSNIKDADLRSIDLEGPSFSIGSFEISPFRVNHSIPDALGLVIQTPVGRVAHVSDFKFDWTPVDGRTFEVSKLGRLVETGVLALFSDCLGSQNEGYTRTERDIEDTFDYLLDGAVAQVFITSISSNISRIQQAIQSSLRHNRRIVLLGRSVTERTLIAEKLGYLDFPKKIFVNPRKAKSIPDNQLTYIVAGCYGQPGSGLWRIANETHQSVQVKEDALVVFSGDPSPPGVKDNVDAVVDKLTRLGADVHYYEIQENLHVSGHGSQGDLLMLAAMVKPKYFIPIGGDPVHMRSYGKLVSRLGVAPGRVFELPVGRVLELREDSARLGKEIPMRSIMVDGYGIGDIGRVVLRDRKVLAESGMLVVFVQIDSDAGKISGDVEVISRGLIFVKESKDLIRRFKEIVKKTVEKHKGHRKDLGFIREKIEEELEQYIYNKLGRTPMIIPVLIEV
jgi:ribonuclease J